MFDGGMPRSLSTSVPSYGVQPPNSYGVQPPNSYGVPPMSAYGVPPMSALQPYGGPRFGSVAPPYDAPAVSGAGSAGWADQFDRTPLVRDAVYLVGAAVLGLVGAGIYLYRKFSVRVD